jgi:hypothetical protein
VSRHDSQTVYNCTAIRAALHRRTFEYAVCGVQEAVAQQTADGAKQGSADEHTAEEAKPDVEAIPGLPFPGSTKAVSGTVPADSPPELGHPALLDGAADAGEGQVAAEEGAQVCARVLAHSDFRYASCTVCECLCISV